MNTLQETFSQITSGSKPNSFSPLALQITSWLFSSLGVAEFVAGFCALCWTRSYSQCKLINSFSRPGGRNLFRRSVTLVTFVSCYTEHRVM